MAMKGIPLTDYAADALTAVDARFDQDPAKSIDLEARLGARVADWVRRDRGLEAGADILTVAHAIPMRILERLTRDEICKIRHSSTYILETSVEDAFKADGTLRLYDKIRNSMWRWGVGRGGWGETVDAFRGISRFDLGHDAFTLTLDMTTGCNERGYSEHSRTFLDGVFGYLVHYKGEHVMTIGFSVMDGRRLLIQQIQAKSRTGNRWLFKLPRDLVGHVVDRFAAAFPAHDLHIVDGGDLMGGTIENYNRGLDSAIERLARAERSLERDPRDAYAQDGIASAKSDIAELKTRIAHAKADRARIKALYQSSRRHALGKAVKVNGLRHYAVSAVAEPLQMAA